MPKVPVYGAQQEALRPLPGVRQESVASPELFGAQAREQIDTGKALVAAGTGVSAVAVKLQEREDADSIFRAETTLKDEYLQYEQEVRKNRQGRFAKDLTKDTDKWFQDRLKHHTENLTTDSQRRIFGERATRLRQQAASSVSAWEAAQMEKSHDESWLSNKSTSISVAAANATPENVDAARLEIDKLNRYQAARKGWEPERLTAETLKDTTTLHKQVIQSIVRTDPVAAKAYFDKYKGEIDGTEHAEIGAFAEKVSANAIGEKAAGGVWETMGPKSDRTPVELDKMEEALRKELKGNEPALDSAIRRLRERTQAFKDARKERDEGKEARVNEAIMKGAGASQIARMPEFNELSPEKARSILESVERLAASRSARADAEESRAQRRLTRQGIEAAYRLSDPQRLVKLSRDEVVNLLPVLGPEHVGNLLQRWDSFSKSSDKLTEATIDKQLFDTVALEVGLRPNEKAKSEEEKNQLVRLQNHVESIIAQEQKTKGKALTREEKAELMRKELDKEILVQGRVWGTNTVRAPLASPEEIRRSVIKLDRDGKQEDFRLSTIPQKDYDEIVRARRDRGLPVTPESIADTYFKGQKR